MATHSSTLAWKILWTEEPGRLHWVAKSRTRLSLFTFRHWRRKWRPTPVFLPGESQGRRSLAGCHLWGRTESDGHDCSNLAAAAARQRHTQNVVGKIETNKQTKKECCGNPEENYQSSVGKSTWLITQFLKDKDCDYLIHFFFFFLPCPTISMYTLNVTKKYSVNE